MQKRKAFEKLRSCAFTRENIDGLSTCAHEETKMSELTDD